MYEFWQGANTYGLALLERKNPAFDRRDTPRPGKVVEKRESDLGTVLLFEDFMDYKTQLAALLRMPTNVNQRSAEQQKTSKAQSPTSWNFEIEGAVPGTCVDWSTIEEVLKSQG